MVDIARHSLFHHILIYFYLYSINLWKKKELTPEDRRIFCHTSLFCTMETTAKYRETKKGERWRPEIIRKTTTSTMTR